MKSKEKLRYLFRFISQISCFTFVAFEREIFRSNFSCRSYSFPRSVSRIAGIHIDQRLYAAFVSCYCCFDLFAREKA